MKRLIFITVLIMLCFTMAPLGYCGEGFDDKEIRIGSWGPQSGPAAPWGSISRGAQFLAMYINEQGGIHGRKIKFFLRDDKYNPAETKVIAKDLVERMDVMAVTAGLGTAPTLAVKDYLAEHKVVAVGMCTGTKEHKTTEQICICHRLNQLFGPCTHTDSNNFVFCKIIFYS